MELSDDDDDDPMDGKGAGAGGDDSDADSVLKMDPITISSSSDEQSDDEMDISGESDGGSTARAAKSRRKQQAGSKTPVSSRVGASSTVAAAKRTPVEYYQGKVEVSQAGINLGVGVAKIMDLGADEYELRLSFKLTANAANGSALQPRPDIVSTKAQLVGARFDEEKRTMSWQRAPLPHVSLNAEARADSLDYSQSIVLAAPYVSSRLRPGFNLVKLSGSRSRRCPCLRPADRRPHA